ncbi:hypothetical protein L1D32_09715 [Shewanella insulae]|uniref:hypothetical protein n=1 Tax=Shewanella insulae TaxID=2681496 RepID=UPI001EFDC033|nr:hypothetical protein [Shewanella insulae]MCG9738430.1 hypothetical protein [Shewanella insulae]
MQRLLLMGLLLMLGSVLMSPRTQAAEVDYGLEANVYLWYANLDMGQADKRLAPQSDLVDYAEYAGSLPSQGAHHLMSITPIARSQEGVEVEVETEFQLASPNDGETEVRGQYVVQRLSLDNQGLVRSSVTLVNEYDDFTSRYRPAVEINLVRAALYDWTESLDKLDDNRLLSLLGKDAGFIGPEDPTQSPSQYLAYLHSLNHSDSRRAIKNYSLTPEAGQYRLSFEYQWTAINSDGEIELARIGVTMLIAVTPEGAKVLLYRAEYLPPVTDLGAEVRC